MAVCARPGEPATITSSARLAAAYTAKIEVDLRFAVTDT